MIKLYVPPCVSLSPLSRLLSPCLLSPPPSSLYSLFYPLFSLSLSLPPCLLSLSLSSLSLSLGFQVRLYCSCCIAERVKAIHWLGG